MNAEPIYRFGTCEVLPRQRQVRCDGVLAESQPKAFDLLLYLIANRDRVVDKDELLAKLWPRSVVTESALTQIVRKARSLVGDDGARQTVIRTFQRRGFRFIAPVEAAASEPGPLPSAQKRAVEASVAVLPFVDMSPERDQEYFCDGMAEEITNELVQIPGLRVAARTSAFAFKNRAHDVREIGSHLGVKSVLEGSVRKAGDRLRVTAQLVDAESGFHLWSERFDRPLEDMLAVQAEIAERIASALRRPQAAHAGAESTFTVDDFCRRGLAYLHRHGQRSQRFAIDLFRQALAIAPESARAWAGLAMSHAMLYRAVATGHRGEAAEAAARASELDPRSPEAWTARGMVAAIARDFPGAEAAFKKALLYGPALFEAHYYYGHACTENGRFEQAAGHYERAAELRPDDYQALVFACQVYRSLGMHEQARDAARRQLVVAERALANDPTDARALSLSAGSLILVGRITEARAWTTRACALEPDEPYVHYNAACAFALLGEIDAALTALERGTEGPNLCRPTWVERDTDLDPLRDHPRFKALLAELADAARGGRIEPARGHAAVTK
jgi:adenylate cyclase